MEKDILGTLGINLNQFLGQLFNFAVVFFVMWRWVYKPLVKQMDERGKKIEDGLAHAKEAERRLAEATAEHERIVKEARADAHGMLEQTREHAETVRKDKLMQTKTEIEKIAVEAKEQIRMEREAAFGALKQDIALLVSMATQKVAAGMDEKGQRQLIDQAIKDVENA
jgi:F-type H+-transporting ATPase subunit b